MKTNDEKEILRFQNKMQKVKMFFVLLCSILLVGCENANGTLDEAENIMNEADKDDFLLLSTEGSDTYNVNVTPYNLKYNDETFSLESISVFQNYSDYEYYLYIVLQFNFSSLSDEGYHWLMEDQESSMPTFDTNVYLTSESNTLQTKPMGRLYYSYDRTSATYIYHLLNGYKYDFSDSDISVNVNVEQDETYTASSGAEYPRTKYYYFDTKSGLDIPITDFSEIPEDIYADILSGYERLNKAIKSLK